MLPFAAVFLSARIFDLASGCARWVAARGWPLLGAAALGIALSGVVAPSGTPARAGVILAERKLPMKFSWVACQPNCRGWISAVGIVTADSPRDFDEFARGRELGGVTIVLDSSGGSVNDSIALGRRWRSLGALTTLGTSTVSRTAQGERASVMPEAYCESMCVFLLLSGKTKAASYTAQDLMIVERDIGRLAKYSFDMGGAGDLLSLSLSLPPWEDLHELSAAELGLTNLVTTDAVAEVLPQAKISAVPVAELAKPVKDRFVSSTVESETDPRTAKSTSTAEAMRHAGRVRATATPPREE